MKTDRDDEAVPFQGLRPGDVFVDRAGRLLMRCRMAGYPGHAEQDVVAVDLETGEAHSSGSCNPDSHVTRLPYARLMLRGGT